MNKKRRGISQSQNLVGVNVKVVHPLVIFQKNFFTRQKICNLPIMEYLGELTEAQFGIILTVAVFITAAVLTYMERVEKEEEDEQKVQ